MRYMAIVLGLVVAFTLGLLGIVHSRRSMELQLTKTAYFESVKQKVTSDMLKEFQSNIAEANIKLEKTKKQIVELEAEVKTAQEVADGKKAELNTCNSEMSQTKADIDALEAEKSKTNNEFEQNKVSFNEKINNLKIEIEKRSPVCDYIIKTSVEGMKLCGIVPVLPAEQKPAEQKPAEQKPAAPPAA